MRVTEISMTFGRVYNLGNYENIRIESTLTATIEEGDQLPDVRAKLLDELIETMKAQRAKVYPENANRR